VRLVVVAASGPLLCVYCHDALGVGPLDACKKCGTRYHTDCAKLAGTCALIGCEGSFERSALATSARERLALIVKSVASPTREPLAATARVLRAMEWDARQRLGSRVMTALAALLGAKARKTDRTLERLGAAHMRHVFQAMENRWTNRDWLDATSLLLWLAGGARP